MEATLSLPEQLLLLCLNDETGRSEELYLRQGLEGAVLAELLLQERVGVDEEGHLGVFDPTPTGDALLDQALARIEEAAKPRKSGEWIGKLVPNNLYPSEPVLHASVATRLIERGILTRQEDRLLWVLPNPVYPTQNAHPERRLREQLRAALLESGPVDARLGALIALLHATDALDRVLTPEEVAQVGPRIEELRQGTPAGQGSGGAVSHAVAAKRNFDTYMGYQSLFDGCSAIFSLVLLFVPQD